MAFNDFIKDLVESEIGVNKLVELLQRKGATEVELSNAKEYDVAYTSSLNQKITLEVKEDFLYQKTGNVAIEYMQWDKPTGISSSTADYYVYKLSNDFFSIKRESLQAKIESSVAANQTRKVVTYDKKKKIDLYLVPVAVFTSWCKQII